MIKNKLDFKLINIALIAIICYFIYQSSDLWLNIVNKIISIISPLFLGFVLAYAIYPFINYLNKYKIPKVFGIFLVLSLILIILFSVIILLIPILKEQIISLIDYLIIFIQNVNIENKYLNQIIIEATTYIPTGIFKTINSSIDVLSTLIITLVISIYFILDMDKIKNLLKKHLNYKIFNYLKTIDIELQKYIKGFMKIVFISFFEYTFFYSIIGHPNAVLLGILASISNFIPYFGGIIVQIISVITGLVINPTLGIKVAIVSLILGLFDSYILNPIIYGKTNELHPIIIITSVFAGGILFGFIGIILAIPISIVIITSYKYFKDNKLK